MPQVSKTPNVIEELAAIAIQIAEDNPAAAISWLAEIEAAMELLASQPELGERLRTRRYGEVRRHVRGNYLIYYRESRGGIEVLAVSHGAREQGRLLE